MKIKVIGPCIAFISVLLLLSSAQFARAQCTTQGALALALAQILGNDVTEEAEAVAALKAVGVKPAEDWQPGSCVTEDIVKQLDEALKTAVAAGFVPGADAAGALAYALESIGEGGLAGMLSSWPTWTARSGGAPMGGPSGGARDFRGGIEREIVEPEPEPEPDRPPVRPRPPRPSSPVNP